VRGGDREDVHRVSVSPRRRVHLPDRTRLGAGSRLPSGSARSRADTACESFAGVANPFSLEPSPPASTCSTWIRSGMTVSSRPDVGVEGSVTGIDMTPADARARPARHRRARANERPLRPRRGRIASVRERVNRRRHLQRRDSTSSPTRTPSSPSCTACCARWPHAARRRHYPAPRQRRRPTQHRSLDRVELPALCWKQSTQTGLAQHGFERIEMAT